LIGAAFRPIATLTDDHSGDSIFGYRQAPEPQSRACLYLSRYGTVETVTSTNFPNYPKENIRSKCNDHKVRVMQVNYQSAEKYVGSDELELLVLFPGGFAWEVHFDVDVR